MSDLPRPGALTALTVASRYDALVAKGTLERDGGQLVVVSALDRLAALLSERVLARKSSALGWLFGRRSAEPVKGLYIWGSVGCGKTMLMDLFYEGLVAPGKRRVHFHAYMAEVHERIHAWRQRLKAGEVEGNDPIAPVAADLARESQILCFDEFAVTDIADAMILGRLFKALLEHGVVVVSTSNVPPDELYKDGLNRALFLPFIALIEEHMSVLRLNARTDYRLEKLGEAPVYFAPADEAAWAAIDSIFERLTGAAKAKPSRLMVHSHPIEVPAQAMGVARFPYATLFKRPLAASDYIAIARAFHTVMVDGIPLLRPDQRDEARRLITFIDVMYDRRIKLIASAAAKPEDLYHAETGAEAFEFARTVSRMTEMRSQEYLALPRGRGQTVSGNTTGLVET